MHASASDDESSEAMFPAANEPAATGQDSALSNLLASPPLSQDPSEQVDAGFPEDAMDSTESASANVGENGFEPQFRSVGGISEGAGDGQRPHTRLAKFMRGREVDNDVGHTWNSGKAWDEYRRALEQVVDKTFNLSMSIPDLVIGS